MNGEDEKGAEHYRRRAETMLELAQNAETEELRQGYMALAANWSRLAESAGPAGKDPA